MSLFPGPAEAGPRPLPPGVAEGRSEHQPPSSQPLTPGHRPTTTARIDSLDQFRGYTVAGMILVNFVGGYAAVPAVLKHHHTYCSYADTIMPGFLFAVGFAYRLTFLRRIEKAGPRDAYGHALRRNLGLVLFGMVLYNLDGRFESWAALKELGLRGFLATAFQREPFQALVHIGVTALWMLPVMAARSSVLARYAAGSAALHLALSAAFYYEFALKRPVIDGGPLGFLTWSIPLAAGALAYDAVARRGFRRALAPIVGRGLLLMGLGYAMSCLDARALIEPPFVPPSRPVNLWTMSQRAGSVSYLTFGAGFSLAAYALFLVACDLGPLRVGLFRTLGTNALAAYVLHEIVFRTVKPFVPRDAPGWYVAAGCLAAFGLIYLFVRHLERQAIFIRM